MKFAFLIFKYFPYGGVQRDMLRIAQDCVRLGHAVTIMTGEWRGDRPSDIEVKLFESKGWLNHHKQQSLMKQMHRAVQRMEVDRVVGFNRMPGLDVYFAADPCYAERMHHEPWYKRLFGRYRFFSEVEAAVFNDHANTHILLLNQQDQAVFQRWYQTPDWCFHVIPPHIPQARFATLPAQDYRQYVRQTFQLPVDAIVLLTVGSAFVRKGVDRAINALSSLPPALKDRCWLLAVGEFESNSNLRAYAEKRGVAARCIEAGGRPDVAELMLGCDLLIHAARSELAGIVLIEAMTAGLPILVSAVCGYASYVEQAQAGKVLTQPFNQAEMNVVLADMLQSPLKKSWANNARAFIAKLAANQQAMPEASLISQL